MSPKKKSVKKAATRKSVAVKKKVAVKKSVAVKKKSVKKRAATKKRVVKKQAVQLQVSPRERYEMIATMAYYRAEKRNFKHGHAYQDWMECEAIVDQMLAK